MLEFTFDKTTLLLGLATVMGIAGVIMGAIGLVYALQKPKEGAAGAAGREGTAGKDGKGNNGIDGKDATRPEDKIGAMKMTNTLKMPYIAGSSFDIANDGKLWVAITGTMIWTSSDPSD